MVVPKMIVRPLEPADVEAVVEVALAAWAPIYASYRRIMGDELFRTAHPDWRREKARQVRDGCAPAGTRVGAAAIAAVAELPPGDGQPARLVGFVTAYVRASLGIGEIGNNAVHPDWQGQGIAPRLYEYAFDCLRERGMRYVKVLTGGDPSHAPARHAYQKVGFEIALPHVEYYREL
jgi:ribosomal protein S18 acetylase RimI-like enzyme